MLTYETKEYILSYEMVTCFSETGISISNFFPKCKIEHLKLPDTIDGTNIIQISNLAFFKNNSSYVDLPKSLVFIDTSAFESNERLKEITFPKSLIKIGPAAFQRCKSLEDVNFNEGLISIDSGAFRYTKIKNINLPDSLNSIRSYAFSGVHSKTVSFGSHLKSIGAYAFSSNDFKTVKLPESLEYLYGGAFNNNDFLESIYIGENIGCLNVNEHFLYACNNLKNITVSPDNLFFTSINGIMYDNDEGIIIRVPPKIETDSIIIPPWVKRISPGCFQGVQSGRIIIKTPDILGIEKAGINPSVNITCIRNSELKNKLKELGYKNISSLNSQIDEFINSLGGDKDIKK